MEGQQNRSSFIHFSFSFLMFSYISLWVISHHLPQNRNPQPRRVCTGLKAEDGTGQLPSSTFYSTCTPMPVRTKTILGRIWGTENKIFSEI